jgi:CRP-like cAMP-binding protein
MSFMAQPTIAHAVAYAAPTNRDFDHGEKRDSSLPLRLSRVDLLEELSSEDIDWLSQRTPEVHLDQGQIFYTPANTAQVIYLLLEGQMRLYQVVEGNELTLEVLEAGQMFGEAALAGEPQGLYAQAMQPTSVGLLGLHVLESLVQKNPEVGLKAMKLLSNSLLSYRNKLVDIGLKEVRGRLASLILHLIESEGVVTAEGTYKIPTRYTHEQLATMIGAKRPAVTRAFGELQRDTAVQLRRRYIHVRDMDALEYLAQAA